MVFIGLGLGLRAGIRVWIRKRSNTIKVLLAPLLGFDGKLEPHSDIYMVNGGPWDLNALMYV